jgi:hypothetical protein
MAVKASTHRKLVDLRENIHILHGPMTIRAPDAFVHVDAVVEIREIWHRVDALPRKGNALLIVFRQFNDFRPGFP